MIFKWTKRLLGYLSKEIMYIAESTPSGLFDSVWFVHLFVLEILYDFLEWDVNL